ncbi:MAG: hypothetical protein ACTSR8_00440 [Promethearchaeota archaeon]
MSNITQFSFKEAPKELAYSNKPPMTLAQDLMFFHNKAKFRPFLNELQYSFKNAVGVALHAAGIRDTYLKEEYSENYFIVILGTHETSKKTNQIIKKNLSVEIEKGCYYIEVDSDYILLLAKDMEGIKQGIKTFETILQQTFDSYFEKKNFDEYIKVPTLTLYHCSEL